MATVVGNGFGGSDREEGWAVALDAGANPWIGGTTDSADFPLVDPIQPAHIHDGFLVELGPSPDDLACNVDFSQPAYTNGQTVQVTSLRFQNTTLLPKKVRLRLRLAPPGQSAFMAADLTTWFAPGFSADLAPVSLHRLAGRAARADHDALRAAGRGRWDDPRSGRRRHPNSMSAPDLMVSRRGRTAARQHESGGSVA